MSQNKELKTNIAELQDAFVRLSQQNMELASELETERHHVGQLQRRMREVESRAESDHTHMVTNGETVGPRTLVGIMVQSEWHPSRPQATVDEPASDQPSDEPEEASSRTEEVHQQLQVSDPASPIHSARS